ncbi:MAG TPA: right-handed parallel beta-helix repeat-containing protein [Flavitalea sp.]|nr:right-handed parallel beta-helix repeat-containing protein [Flavitalea sp.]
MRDKILLITGVLAIGILSSSFNSDIGNANDRVDRNAPTSVSAGASGNYFFLTVNSLADLKRLKPTADGQLVTMTYKLSSSDNCGGQFEWDAYSTTSPDDAIVVQSSVVSSGRWKRVISSKKYYARWWSPVASGADQSARINQMILAIPSSSTLEFDANKIYNISSQINLWYPINVIGNNTTLVYKGATTTIVNIRSSYVTITALNVTGDLANYDAGGYGIAAEKGTNSRFTSNIIIQNCVVKNYKHTAIWLRYVKNFKVLNNTISNFAYGGVIVSSCVSGVISDNNISNITAKYTTQGNAYGIQIRRGASVDSASKNIMITNNTINGCPWEGLDTHGGQDLTFSGNKLYNCNTGIAIVSNHTDGTQAPRNVFVKNNYIENLKNPTGSAIVFNGVDASDPATGLISYNTCKGYGIKLNRTRGIIVTGNTVIQPNQAQGISLKEYNTLASITLNTITDVWAPNSDNTAAIKFMLQYNDAYIDGNVLSVGSFVPPSGSKNNFGFRPDSEYGTNKAYFGKNNFTAAKRAQYANATCATFNINAGSIKTIADASYSIASDVKYVVYSVLTSTKTLTLPSASSYPKRILYIRHAGSGTVTLALSTAVKRSGGSNITSLTFKNQCSLVSDGKYWWTMSQNF